MKIFLEEQKFTQVWLHILLVISFVVSISVKVKEYVESNSDAVLGELIVALGALLLIYVLIFSLKLKTRIDEKGIQFRFIPFHFKVKSISWNEVDKAYIRKYNPIAEYGGWGIKGRVLWWKGNGVAYNVKGNLGMQLELKSGKKILIGTQKEEEVNRVLQTYINKTASYES